MVGPVVKGTYSTTRLAVRLTLTLSDGWNLENETTGELALSRGPFAKDSSLLRFVMLRHATQVVPPFVADEETPLDWRRRSKAAPSDYIAFVQGLNQYLDAGPLTTLVVGGRQATAIRYTVARQPGSPAGTCYQEPGPCFAPPSGIRLDLVPLPVGTVVQAAVADTPAGPMLVEASAPDAAPLDVLLAEVDPMLRAVRIG